MFSRYQRSLFVCSAHNTIFSKYSTVLINRYICTSTINVQACLFVLLSYGYRATDRRNFPHMGSWRTEKCHMLPFRLEKTSHSLGNILSGSHFAIRIILKANDWTVRRSTANAVPVRCSNITVRPPATKACRYEISKML